MKKALEELIESKAKELKEFTNPEELAALAELVNSYNSLGKVESAENALCVNSEVIAEILTPKLEKSEQIHLKDGGYCNIDNVTEGHHIDGPATISVIRTKKLEEKDIYLLLQAIDGINSSQWSRIKQNVDLYFSSKAAKVVLDDSTKLKRNLEVEFNLRRFGEKLD